MTLMDTPSTYQDTTPLSSNSERTLAVAVIRRALADARASMPVRYGNQLEWSYVSSVDNWFKDKKSAGPFLRGETEIARYWFLLADLPFFTDELINGNT